MSNTNNGAQKNKNDESENKKLNNIIKKLSHIVNKLINIIESLLKNKLIKNRDILLRCITKLKQLLENNITVDEFEKIIAELEKLNLDEECENKLKEIEGNLDKLIIKKNKVNQAQSSNTSKRISCININNNNVSNNVTNKKGGQKK